MKVAIDCSYKLGQKMNLNFGTTITIIVVIMECMRLLTIYVASSHHGEYYLRLVGWLTMFKVCMHPYILMLLSIELNIQISQIQILSK